MPRKFGPTYRRTLAILAQDIARRRVLPWLSAERQGAEREYAAVSRRFAQMGNEFLQKLSEGGVAELSRRSHALDVETGFRAGSRFSFPDLIEIAQPASPLRWLADTALALVGARKVIQRQVAEFLEHLLDTNSARILSDILNRVQESRSWLEVEIRKLLHEVSRIAEQALAHARSAQTAGASVVQSQLARLAGLEQEIRELRFARAIIGTTNGAS